MLIFQREDLLLPLALLCVHGGSFTTVLFLLSPSHTRGVQGHLHIWPCPLQLEDGLSNLASSPSRLEPHQLAQTQGKESREKTDSSFLDIILAGRNNCWMPSIAHTCCFTDTVLHKSIQTLKRVSLTFKNLHCNAHLWYLYFIKTETKKFFLYVALSYRNTNKTEILYLSKKSFYYYYFFNSDAIYVHFSVNSSLKGFLFCFVFSLEEHFSNLINLFFTLLCIGKVS